MSDETTSSLAREAAKAPDDPVAAERLLVARAREGDKEAQEELREQARTRWLAEREKAPIASLTPLEIIASRNNYGSTDEERARYYALDDARTTLEDETAEARAMARRGEAPRPTWKPNVTGPKLDALGVQVGFETEADPRMVAWKDAAWKRLKSSARELGAWGLPDEVPDYDGLLKLERSLEAAHKAVAGLRSQTEIERGM